MKTTRSAFVLLVVVICFLLVSCTVVGTAVPLPTAISTVVPIVIPPTATLAPTITAVPIVAPPTQPPMPTITAVPNVAPPVTTATFAEQVVQAFNTGDYGWINAHMGSEFTFAGWQAGGSALPPAAAVDQLRTVYFGSGSTPIFQTGIDTTAVLGGVNPLSLWGPETAVTDPNKLTNAVR